MLARSETAALLSRDFAAVGKTQQIKASILADLSAEAARLHANRDPHARARLTQLLESTRQNRRLLSRMMDTAADDLRKVRSATNQLHTLRTAYTSGGKSLHRTFSAHG
jgi:uncharacterized protein YigA (DUF484 family)